MRRSWVANPFQCWDPFFLLQTNINISYTLLCSTPLKTRTGPFDKMYNNKNVLNRQIRIGLAFLVCTFSLHILYAIFKISFLSTGRALQNWKDKSKIMHLHFHYKSWLNVFLLRIHSKLFKLLVESTWSSFTVTSLHVKLMRTRLNVLLWRASRKEDLRWWEQMFFVPLYIFPETAREHKTRPYSEGFLLIKRLKSHENWYCSTQCRSNLSCHARLAVPCKKYHWYQHTDSYK